MAIESVDPADELAVPYVLDHGVLVEEGTHEELSAAGGLYAQLYALQATAYQDGNVLDDQTLDHRM
ncbi:hypothetical protein OHA72_54365 [Dactylosporangium sp. NBC_01737]|uniref:hypothetical protein n=1 Tax=Dactylosporangium sp. NBC_01737 TaxID=2975959 RepID=UPI002E0E0868|nr:hypothetical protein OHA72_54365 [Dactylosporangium sp. NBC_01737]